VRAWKLVCGYGKTFLLFFLSFFENFLSLVKLRISARILGEEERAGDDHTPMMVTFFSLICLLKTFVFPPVSSHNNNNVSISNVFPQVVALLCCGIEIIKHIKCKNVLCQSIVLNSCELFNVDSINCCDCENKNHANEKFNKN
jgi:hypothetical protein